MPDTTVNVRYIGTYEQFSEVSITGYQQVWRKGMTAYVDSSRASSLVASGSFESASPAATTGVVGAGFTVNPATGLAETTISGDTFVIPPKDPVTGGMSGIVSHRSGTLDALLSIPGQANEIGIPTDIEGIVCYTGVAGEAYYVGSAMWECDISDTAWEYDPDVYAVVIPIPRGVRNILVVTSNAPNAAIQANGDTFMLLPQQDQRGVYTVSFRASPDLNLPVGRQVAASFYGPTLPWSSGGQFTDVSFTDGTAFVRV